MTPIASPQEPAASRAGASGPLPSSDGPGWYESSWDLRRGLDVEEVAAQGRYPAAGGADAEPPSAT